MHEFSKRIDLSGKKDLKALRACKCEQLLNFLALLLIELPSVLAVVEEVEDNVEVLADEGLEQGFLVHFVAEVLSNTSCVG